MKKLHYFIPAILLAALDVSIWILGIDTVPLPHFLWLALFCLAGILLVRRWFWGAICGLMPAFEFIRMSTIYTGQVIPIELPLGISLSIYYLLCGLWVFRKHIHNA